MVVRVSFAPSTLVCHSLGSSKIRAGVVGIGQSFGSGGVDLVLEYRDIVDGQFGAEVAERAIDFFDFPAVANTIEFDDTDAGTDPEEASGSVGIVEFDVSPSRPWKM